MSDYSSEKRNIYQAMAEQDKIKSLEAENKKLRKCLNAEWDEMAVDKILTDVEKLKAELANLKVENQKCKEQITLFERGITTFPKGTECAD